MTISVIMIIISTISIISIIIEALFWLYDLDIILLQHYYLSIISEALLW